VNPRASYRSHLEYARGRSLYEALGFTLPELLICRSHGTGPQSLSKRHGATSVAEFRSKGYLPEALVNTWR